MKKIRNIAIMGAGGAGRTVADIIRHRAAFGDNISTVGFIDEDPALAGLVLSGLPVLGDFSWFNTPARRSILVVCAVGAPVSCRKLALRAIKIGLSFAEVISPLAYVSPTATLGQGVTLFPYTVVSDSARLGDHSMMGVGSSVGHDSVMGACSILNPGARLAGNVTLGEGCNIGMGAVVIQGRTIGAWTTVGAGAAVVRDLPANVTAVGIPAKPISKPAHRKPRRG